MAEDNTGQAMFVPWGQLSCFLWAPVRSKKNVKLGAHHAKVSLQDSNLARLLRLVMRCIPQWCQLQQMWVGTFHSDEGDIANEQVLLLKFEVSGIYTPRQNLKCRTTQISVNTLWITWVACIMQPWIQIPANLGSHLGFSPFLGGEWEMGRSIWRVCPFSFVMQTSVSWLDHMLVPFSSF